MRTTKAQIRHSDQCLLYSLLTWYNICSFYIQNLKPLASLLVAEQASLSFTWSQKTDFLVKFSHDNVFKNSGNSDTYKLDTFCHFKGMFK